MDLLDRLTAAFDQRQRRKLGIWEFTDDPACILRLGLTTAHLGAELADGTVVKPGDTVGVIHLWNERMPQIPSTGPNIAWAQALNRSLAYSLRLVARYVLETPTFDHIHAFGGEFPFVFTPVSIRLLRRLGIEAFEPLPQRGARWVVDVASRIWVWLMRRAFNPQSIKGLRLDDVRRRPVWMSKRTLIALHGPASSPLSDARSETRAAP